MEKETTTKIIGGLVLSNGLENAAWVNFCLIRFPDLQVGQCVIESIRRELVIRDVTYPSSNCYYHI
jgi:hypothetical protein